jgi:hypothetical protein
MAINSRKTSNSHFSVYALYFCPKCTLSKNTQEVLLHDQYLNFLPLEPKFSTHPFFYILGYSTKIKKCS